MTTRRRRARRKAGVGAVTDDGATGEGAGAWPATGRTGVPYQCPWADATQVARTRAGTHAVTQPRRERTGLRRTGVRGSQDRKSVVEGKSVSVRVDLGGRRIIKKKKETKRNKEAHKK